MPYVIQLLLSLVIVTISFFWLINEDGYEPKVVFFTSILGLVAILFNRIKAKETSVDKNPPIESSLKNKTTPLGISNTIKSYDKFYYYNKVFYSNIIVFLVFILISSVILVSNTSVINKYERILSGEVREEGNNEFMYKENGEVKTLEEIKVERNQIVFIFLFFSSFFLVVSLRPFLISLVCRRLQVKLEFIYQLDDFESFSIEVNQYLVNYLFLSDEVLCTVINSFTRIKKECYVNNLLSKNS